MSIEFGCTDCGKLLRVPDASAGKQARCPSCHAILGVPTGKQLPPSDPMFSAQADSKSTLPSDQPAIAETSSGNPFTDGQSPASDSPFSSGTNNPYAAPAGGQGLSPDSFFAPGSEDWARSTLEGPANSLAAIAGIVLVFSVIGLAANLAGALSNGDVEQGIVVVLGTLLFMVPYGLVVYGANQMKQLQNYKLAIAASIIAMLPCSGCCIIGLPVGIWSLVILCKPEIRAVFR